MTIKEMILNVLSILGVLSGNIVFGTIGAIILVITTVIFLICVTEHKSPSYMFRNEEETNEENEE